MRVDERTAVRGWNNMVSWRRSIAVRYLVISLIAALVPLFIVWALYDQYSSGLIHSLTGERLERRLVSMSGRLRAFLDARWYSLESLAGYPALATLLTRRRDQPVGESLKAVLEFEADQPDLYGVLLLRPDYTLARAIPGQAASGPPYWGAGSFSLDGINRISAPQGEIIGPIPPDAGRPGSFLMVRDLPGRGFGTEPAGKIALHVRLASLTELLGTEDETGLFYPVLLSPGGIAYSTVGIPVHPANRIVKSDEILPGWRPALVVKWDELGAPLKRGRYVMLAAVISVGVALPLVFVVLFRRARRRIALLVDGAQEVASGNLSWRIRSVGRDEIAVLATAFNRMADRLQQVIRSAVDMEKMAVLGQFAAGVAHEVRNPLAAMKTSVQALSLREENLERRAILGGLSEEIDRLDETLEELLTFARPRKPQFENVSLRDVFRRIAAMVEQQARDRGVTVVTDDAQNLAVHADGGHLQQIMMNLILNALQAMPEGGVLSLRATRRDGKVAIEVKDTGVGIDGESLSKITDPFYTTRRGGTGLGLAITRQLVELNQGELRFESALGEGTTVTVVLSDQPAPSRRIPVRHLEGV